MGIFGFLGRKNEGFPSSSQQFQQLENFLTPEAVQVLFEEKTETGVIYKAEKQGTAVSVRAFDYKKSGQNAETDRNKSKFVIKKYDFPDQDMRALFGENCGRDMNTHEQASFLQERHQRVKKFFEMVPNLDVVPTQFVVSGKHENDAHVFEIQRRIEGHIFESSFLQRAIDFLKKYPEDKRRELGKTFGQIVACYEQAIAESSKYVPDINAVNFICDHEGRLHLIDTNVEFNFSKNSKIHKSIVNSFMNHINKNLYFFKKLSEFCLS